MRAVVVYESMFGNTRQVAEAIVRGLGVDASAVPVTDVTDEALADLDLLVVGGPTHMHSLSRASSRQMAAEMARKPGSGVTFERGADGPGVREWLASLAVLDVDVAAFDTRFRGPSLFTGRASRPILRLLRRLGGHPVAPPRSFLVMRANTLSPGELAAAREWGATLARHEMRRTPVSR